MLDILGIDITGDSEQTPAPVAQSNEFIFDDAPATSSNANFGGFPQPPKKATNDQFVGHSQTAPQNSGSDLFSILGGNNIPQQQQQQQQQTNNGMSKLFYL
jgi:hypothetical protein